MNNRAVVSVVMVAVDSDRKWLERATQSLANQREVDIELILVDNTSTQDLSIDSQAAIKEVLIVRNPIRPSWFVANNNLGIRHVSGDAILLLNTDAFLEPEYCSRITAAFREHPEVGIVSGKLLRLDAQGQPVAPKRLDSAGMLLTLGQRHLDRGSERLDLGQYDRSEYVYGATGAALAIRQTALRDILLEGYFLDPDFIHGREDGDLCLRAQLLGWRCWYEPRAVGYHIRTVRETGRHEIPAWLRCEHVKDRFLLRINNVPTIALLLLTPVWLFRDLQVLIYVFAKERTSLAAFRWLWANRRRVIAKRQALMKRRKVSSLYMIGLFLGGFRDVFSRVFRSKGDIRRHDPRARHLTTEGQ